MPLLGPFLASFPLAASVASVASASVAASTSVAASASVPSALESCWLGVVRLGSSSLADLALLSFARHLPLVGSSSLVYTKFVFY